MLGQEGVPWLARGLLVVANLHLSCCKAEAHSQDGQCNDCTSHGDVVMLQLQRRSRDSGVVLSTVCATASWLKELDACSRDRENLYDRVPME